MRLLCGDAWAALHKKGDPAGGASSLRPRTDLVAAHQFSIFRFLHPDLAANQPGGSLLGTVMTLEDDVVAYVCRNDLRESVKAFIREAVRRLVARPDVRAVVLNAHSQGTVASYDALQQSSPQVTPQVHALVTAGSPLRKYADLFSWGGDVGATASVGRWLNFWDPKDPVADPLDQPAAWHFGNEVVPREIRDLPPPRACWPATLLPSSAPGPGTSGGIPVGVTCPFQRGGVARRRQRGLYSSTCAVAQF
jgi:hypothetical protein